MFTRINATGYKQITSAQATLNSISEVRPVDIASAKAEVNRTIVAAKQAKANLEQAYVYAPEDSVVFNINTHPGEMVTTDGIVEIGATKDMYVVAEVYQSDVSKIQPEQTVKISSNSLPSDLHGKVEQLGFQNALYDSNTRLNRALLADIVLISPQSRNMQNLATFSRRRLFQASDVAGVKSATAMYIGLATWKNPQTRRKTSMQAIGFNPEQPALNIPEVNNQLDQIKLPDYFLFDRTSRGEYTKVFQQVDVGKIVTTEIDRLTITISGGFTLGASFGADGTLISSDDNFLRIFPRRQAGSIDLGLINIQPGYKPTQVVAALKSHLPKDDIKILTKQEFVQFEEDYWKRESPIGFIFSLGVSMGFIVGVIIVYQVLSTDVNTHIKEYATFKAMGYQNSYLLGVIFEEAIILAVLGFIPGFIFPLGLYKLAANATNLPIYMTAIRALTVLLLTIIMCVFSGTIATQKLQSADPADMF